MCHHFKPCSAFASPEAVDDMHRTGRSRDSVMPGGNFGPEQKYLAPPRPENSPRTPSRPLAPPPAGWETPLVGFSIQPTRRPPGASRTPPFPPAPKRKQKQKYSKLPPRIGFWWKRSLGVLKMPKSEDSRRLWLFMRSLLGSQRKLQKVPKKIRENVS